MAATPCRNRIRAIERQKRLSYPYLLYRRIFRINLQVKVFFSSPLFYHPLLELGVLWNCYSNFNQYWDTSSSLFSRDLITMSLGNFTLQQPVPDLLVLVSPSLP